MTLKVTDVPRAIVRPRRLPKGGTVGIVAPSSQVRDKMLARFVSWLRTKGYHVVLGETVSKIRDDGLVGGTDLTRANDLMEVYLNPKVDAVVAATGGYGTSRIRAYLDYDAIRARPKPIVGFSDTTGLLNAVTARTGVITFLGPTAEMKAGEEDGGPGAAMFDAMFDVISNPRRNWEPRFPRNEAILRMISDHDAAAEGVLFGGNLHLIDKMVGTEWMPGTKGAVIALEEISEAAFSIDAMMQHIQDAGVFDACSAVVLGEFVRVCGGADDPRGQHDGDPSVNQILQERFRAFKKPVVSGLPFSHGEWNTTLPIGARVRVDPRGRRDPDGPSITVLDEVVD